MSRLASTRWWQIGLAVVAGLLLSDQILSPNARVIKVLAGAALFVLAYRAKPFYSLCFIALFFMFPFSIFVGSSTMIFVGLLALIYSARLALGQVPALRRTPVDIPMILLITCYALSFYNVDSPEALSNSLRLVLGYLATFLLYFQTANFIRTEAQLRTFVKILTIGVCLAIFVGLWELAFPGRAIIPHWILFWGDRVMAGAGYRLLGPWADFELYAEYMAMAFFLAFFGYRRATQPHHKVLAAGITVLTVFILLGTVTRGGTLALAGGVVYLTWCLRRRLKARDLISAMGMAILVFSVLEFVVANFTRSGSVITRLLGTTFVGVVPDSRAGWGTIWNRAMEHPIIGHGPYYDLGLSHSLAGKGFYAALWPHNQYLFYTHTIGLLGAAAFLGVAVTLLVVSHRAKAPSLQEASYPRSLMVVLHVMLLVFLVDETKIDYLRNDTYMYFPWILMGLIAATYNIIKDQEADASASHQP